MCAVFYFICETPCMLMSNLHTSFFSRVSVGKTWENCSTSISRSSGVAFSVYYLLAVLIHPYSFSLHIDQVINSTISHDSHPFRGPDFWTEMRVASCELHLMWIRSKTAFEKYPERYTVRITPIICRIDLDQIRKTATQT